MRHSGASSDTGSGRISVPRFLHWESRFFAATQPLWRALGNLESKLLADELAGRNVDRPIYVCSLPRAGTTIITEMLAGCPGVTSFRYSDFPNMWTPYWRNWLLQRSRPFTPSRKERAHGDRIQISNDSPEAVEEILWRHFFPGVGPTVNDFAGNTVNRNPDFDDFYCKTIRKLLLVRGADRYLAKGNYNLSRIPYLLDLFPDARILAPVRHPVSQIASLARQHELFLAAHRRNPRVGRQLALAGHWEFGPFRKSMDFGDGDLGLQIDDAWARGEEVKGWALSWSGAFDHLWTLARNNGNVLVFKYEDLCLNSAETIDRIIRHCQIELGQIADLRAEYIERLSLPDYYKHDFSGSELRLIHEICASAAERLGYKL